MLKSPCWDWRVDHVVVLGEAGGWPVWKGSSLFLSSLLLRLSPAGCAMKSNEQPFQLPIHLRASSSRKPSEINPSCL